MFEKIITGLRLILDRRVPISMKFIPLFTVLYIISPIDLIPEALVLGLGFVDDIALAVWLFNLFTNRASRYIMEEYGTPLKKGAPSENDPGIY
jgi:uncharacterized membrane protein YkvA (DUF1232 family)